MTRVAAMDDLFSTPTDGRPGRVATDPIESLDADQRAAATARDAAVIVKAGAGTGKTRTLVGRIAHLVRDVGLPPESVVAVTFTNKAASEIKTRVAEALGGAVADRLVLGTFHSVSLRILKRNAKLLDLRERFAVVDDDEALGLVVDAVMTCGVLRPSLDEREDRAAAAGLAKEAYRAIKTWKAWGLTPAMIEAPGRARRSESEEAFARVYLSYQDEMRRRGIMDFGDLVLNVVGLFEGHPAVHSRESGNVRHLLVDEAQDANPVQVKWARLMSYEHGQVTSIGDEDQSIFGFQGGFPEAIARIAGEGARTYALTRNRRCTDEILGPAVKLVGWNRRTAKKALASGRSGEAVGLRLLGNEREEATVVAASVRARLAMGASASDVAVLVRSAWTMAPLEEALLKANVPYHVVGGMALSEREEVKDVLAYVRLALDPTDAHAFERVYNRPTRGLGAAAFVAISNGLRSADTFHEACEAVRSADKEPGAERWNAGLAALSKVLATLAAQGASSDCTSRELVDVVLHDKGGGYAAHVASLTDGKAARRRRENLDIMRAVADEEPTPGDFLDRMTLATDADVPNGGPRVRLSTIHSSKGLEWDHVYLPAFVSTVIPSPKALDAPRGGRSDDPWNGPLGGGMEEERRLAHVAFTRARRTLTISASLRRANAPCDPSVFLPEAGLESILSLDAFESRSRGTRAVSVASRGGRKGFRADARGPSRAP